MNFINLPAAPKRRAAYKLCSRPEEEGSPKRMNAMDSPQELRLSIAPALPVAYRITGSLLDPITPTTDVEGVEAGRVPKSTEIVRTACLDL